MTSGASQPNFRCASQSVFITAPSAVGYCARKASSCRCSSAVHTSSSSAKWRGGASPGMYFGFGETSRRCGPGVSGVISDLGFRISDRGGLKSALRNPRSAILLVGVAHHGVDGADEDDGVGHHGALHEVLEALEVLEAGRVHLEPPRGAGAVGDDVEAELALGRLDGVVALGPLRR